MNATANATMVPSDELTTKNVCYRDYATVAPPECYGSLLENCRPSMLQTFPSKLHYLLTCAEKADEGGLKKVVSWQPHGRCFAVHNNKVFVKQVLPNWFMQSKLASFQRQLNLYGFRRFTTGPDKGGYYHELFLRGRPDLAEHIRRTKVKGEGHRKAASPETEPNFYRHFPLPEPPAMQTNQSLAVMLPTHIVGPTLLQGLPVELSYGGGGCVAAAAITPTVPTPPPAPSPPANSTSPPPPANHDRQTKKQENTDAAASEQGSSSSSLPPRFSASPSLVTTCTLNVPNSSSIPCSQPTTAPQPPRAPEPGKQNLNFDPSPLLQQGLFQSHPESLLALRPELDTDHNDAPPLHQAYHNEEIIMDALRAAAPFYPDLLSLSLE